MHVDKRRLEENFFRALMLCCTLLVVGSLFAVLAVILINGLPALSIEMLTQTPKGGYYLGKEGGILNAIIGTIYLAGGATAAAITISLPVALYLNMRPAKSRFSKFVRNSLDILWSVPSIVYGIFGYTIMIYMGMRASLLGGIIALTLLELPIMIRAMDEVMRIVPMKLMEASYALGATKIRTALDVIARQAMPGITMAVMLALGRAAGDAASVLFTAGYSDNIPSSLFEPVASLPLAVFFQLGTPFPEVQQRAYASAAVLLVMMLLLSAGARVATKRFSAYVVR
ncbi:MAG: phosphate ABC transporter permease PstA [Candidatus Diapherotrites archaeon]